MTTAPTSAATTTINTFKPKIRILEVSPEGAIDQKRQFQENTPVPPRGGGGALIKEQMAFLLVIPADQFGVEEIAMKRRPNWKPVIVSDGHRAENGKVGAKAAPTGDEDRLVDIRFTIAAALALGLPALIGAGLYLAVTVVL